MKKERKIVRKSTFNFYIDAILLFLLCFLLGVGLLLEYVLITGEEKIAQLGGNFEQTLFGLDRHQWGDIHLYTGIIFLVIMILHIVLHWEMIVGLFKRIFGGFIFKKSLTIFFAAICCFAIFFALLFEPALGDEKLNHRNKQISLASTGINPSHQAENDSAKTREYKNKQMGLRNNNFMNIRGYMTLKDVCKEHNINQSVLLEELNIRDNLAPSSTFSMIRKKYGVKMSLIGESIIRIKNNSKNS